MSKRVTEQELSDIIRDLLVGDKGLSMGAEDFEVFMADLARVVCKHCGGEVQGNAIQSDDASWYVDIRHNRVVPDDGGVWRHVDPDGWGKCP